MAPGTDGPVKVTDITPASLTADFGVDAVRYHLLREVPLGADGEFSLESMVARYNSDLANNLGNLVARVATVVGSKCGGVGPAPDPGSVARAAASEALAGAAEAWDGLRAPARPRGDVAADRRGQRRARGRRALEAGARRGRRPRAGRRARGPADRGAARRARDALDGRGDLAAHRARRAPPATQRLPDAAAWGQYPGGRARGEGRPALPAAP